MYKIRNASGKTSHVGPVKQNSKQQCLQLSHRTFCIFISTAILFSPQSLHQE